MTHTAKSWAREFVDELESIELDEFNSNLSASSNSLASMNDRAPNSMPSPLDITEISEKFSSSKHRLIITGLAGIVLRAKSLGEVTEDSDSAKENLTQSNYEEENSGGEIWGWQETVKKTSNQNNTKTKNFKILGILALSIPSSTPVFLWRLQFLRSFNGGMDGNGE